jgi:hypothetical protein
VGKSRSYSIVVGGQKYWVEHRFSGASERLPLNSALAPGVTRTFTSAAEGDAFLCRLDARLKACSIYPRRF